MAEFLQHLGAGFVRPLESARGIAMLAFTLSGVLLVIWASFVRTMVRLRALTVGSNVLLLVGGLLAPEPATVLLYAVLFPVNTWRLLEIRRISRQVESASAAGDFSGLWLRPYMVARKLPAGATLFRQGDAASAIYMLVEGEMELVEIGKKVPHGELFGEIAMFSPDHRRTLTARCVTPCLVLGIAEDVFRQLYFQEPEFAFHISNLIAHRLGADLARVRRENEDLRASAAAAQPVPQQPAQVA